MPTSAPATTLLALFALLTSAGVYLAVAHFRTRRLAVVLAVLTLLCFLALHLALAHLASAWAVP